MTDSLHSNASLSRAHERAESSRHMKRTILTIALLLGITSPAFADDPIPAVAAQPADTSPSAGSAAAAPSPSASVPNPAKHPAQAWDDAKAARKSGWAVLVFFVLVGLTKALAYGRDKLQGLPGIGWIARRLAVGKTAMIVAGIGALGAAGYDVLANGGSVTSALMAAGVALAGALHSTTQGT